MQTRIAVAILSLFLIKTDLVFAYSAKDIKLTQFEYTRWVRPQLNSIDQDFKTLLSMMNPHINNLAAGFDHHEKLQEQGYNLKSNCSDFLQQACINQLDSLLESLGELLIQAQEFSLPSNLTHDFPGEHALRGAGKHSEYLISLQDLYFELQNLKFLYSVQASSEAGLASIQKGIKLASKSYHFYILENSDPRFVNAFNSLWNGYIRPINEVIIPRRNKDQFVRLVNDLNLRWNIFHVELTKRNNKVSKPVGSLLTTMHNRWKIVLRVALR